MSNWESAPDDIKQLAERWPVCHEFQLPKDAVVVVAGCYKGITMDLLYRMYGDVHQYGFDPQKWALEVAANRLNEAGALNYTLLNYGIATFNGNLPMDEWGTDACTFMDRGHKREQGRGRVVEFDSAMKKLKIKYIDLAVINMEGYEFPLLSHLIANAWIEKIDRLAIQWHCDLGAGGMPEIEHTLRMIQGHGHRLLWDLRPNWTYSESSKVVEARKVNAK